MVNGRDPPSYIRTGTGRPFTYRRDMDDGSDPVVAAGDSKEASRSTAEADGGSGANVGGGVQKVCVYAAARYEGIGDVREAKSGEALTPRTLYWYGLC